MNCGTFVVLPQPVGPRRTTTVFSRIVVNIFWRWSSIGNRGILNGGLENGYFVQISLGSGRSFFTYRSNRYGNVKLQREFETIFKVIAMTESTYLPNFITNFTNEWLSIFSGLFWHFVFDVFRPFIFGLDSAISWTTFYCLPLDCSTKQYGVHDRKHIRRFITHWNCLCSRNSNCVFTALRNWFCSEGLL